jgi:hypothetical protein
MLRSSNYKVEASLKHFRFPDWKVPAKASYFTIHSEYYYQLRIDSSCNFFVAFHFFFFYKMLLSLSKTNHLYFALLTQS